ncbi:MAG: MotA/TolQ/ExbB proton channel family protein [Bdellovibrio sp.]|nr:MAG: MotA/TolQ/ExbB proton channel family protein [Bdellovibrio sp.]
MGTFFTFMSDAGIVGWCIFGIGLAVTALLVDRGYALFVQFALKGDDLYNKIQSLVSNRKTEEAVGICHDLKKKPLASAFRTILEKADRDDDSIFQAQDIALAENIPQLTKRTHYLSMLANVATLMGLLGTIHGLILSFAAVATADPSQKQQLLAHGISVSMYTTALGLVVAIPAMVFYSLLISRQNHLVDEMTEKCGKLTELLTSGH